MRRKLMRLNKILIIFFVFSLLFVGNFVSAQELLPNDPHYNKQWYLEKLNMPQVWAEETGKNTVIIAVIDSGVDISHPDLRDNIWVNQKEILGNGLDDDNNGYIDDINGWDFVTNTNDPSPKYDKNCLAKNTCIEEAILHGTFIAGVAAAIGNNLQGITGMSWRTKIMPLRVLNQNGAGNTHDVIAAINYAVNNGTDIINLSFVGDTYDPALGRALENAFKAGVLIVAAAGNEDFEGHTLNLDINKMYPVCHQGTDGENIIIGVAASDQNNKLAHFSNHGSSCVDVVAPGQDFFGVVINDPQIKSFGDYYGGYYSGTSLAAPVVSGLAALIKSFSPFLTNKEIRDAILNNTDNIDYLNPELAGKLGMGLINPVKVFQSLKIIGGSVGLVKGSGPTVYYQAVDSKRYIFPAETTYLSWYDDFKNIRQISDAELASLAIGGNVTIRPGSKLVKITSDPKVYAVSRGGVLRWVETEAIARELYGERWALYVVDISDAFFINYNLGEPIKTASDFDPFIEKNQVISIDIDKGLL